MICIKKAEDLPKNTKSSEKDNLEIKPKKDNLDSGNDITEFIDIHGNLVRDFNRDSDMLEMSPIIAAKNSGRIITGTIDQMQKADNGFPIAIVFFSGTKVLIPYDEMFISLTSEEHIPLQAFRKIDYMMGAKIDFVIKGYDIENAIAVASRRLAMKIKRRDILNAKDSDGVTYRVENGTKCTARVIRVHNRFAILEVYGMDILVPFYDLTDAFVSNVRDILDTGAEIKVIVRDISRDDSGNITHLEVTTKNDKQVPLLDPDKSYTGTVVSTSQTAYFVNITGVNKTIRCPIAINHCTATINAGDTVRIFIHGIWQDRETGGIIRIIKKGKTL